MAIRVALQHKTCYVYDRAATLGPQVIRLRPAPHCRTPVVSYSLNITPADHFLNWQQDPQSNYLARLLVNQPTREFTIEVDLVVDLAPINPFDFFLETGTEQYPFRYGPGLLRELHPYFETQPLGPRFKAFLDTLDLTPVPTVDFLALVNQRVNELLTYTLRMDPGILTPEETLENGQGSCRDFAWLLVHLFRHLGLAARFVSGYSIQLAPDEKPVDPDAPAGVDQDVCDLHAWCEVYLPGAGWVGLDATSGLFCGEGHIPLATSAVALNAAPIEGGISECRADFSVDMRVTRVHEDPRVTKPYTDGQWQAILALGDVVDRDLAAFDVRLSMGGEPTFVSLLDQDGEEWTTGAVGPTKKPFSEKLIRRLRARFAPGGLLHFGQGKWYPGEPLPRWALGLYWRKDGIPVWARDDLIGNESVDYEFTHDDARAFADEIARQLDVAVDYVNPAYEDPIHFLARERNLPVNVDVRDSRLDDAQERKQLLDVFGRGLGTPVGYVLPIQRAWKGEARVWHSGVWMLRSKQLYLKPGDSPVGLRLPLDSLPWVEEGEFPHVHPPDPTRRAPALPQRRSQVLTQTQGPDIRLRQKARHAEERDAAASFAEVYRELPQNQVPGVGTSAPWVIRTALCVEARHGRLYVFIPPVESVEDYLDLLTAIEHAADVRGTPLFIEGYTPPHDPRIQFMKVTPDPGVIEVNVHPALGWREMVHNTEVLYHEARHLLLGTDKYQVDGRHTGTGGGNHIVVGGSSPADSPFLRRPDLLKSLVGFWVNHPAMSYLFSGLFIGPTSQAPRIDEGRADAVYEMELAFRQVPRPGDGDLPPWLVDRIFRHLLTDLTGNTHRAEFCIDKLFSPDSATGRLGLVEFRGFEMPPHPRMSLAQQLLLRAMIACFWKVPYEQPLVRWGTRLHDRFMLPHFVLEDFDQVLTFLHEAGYPFQPDWFTTHAEFRFPVVGAVTYDGVDIELRQAIEPWLVLGEEAAGGGTARYVDSSLERLQIKVSGLDLSRYAIAVNRIEVPLHPIPYTGSFVAGIRYRAWQPPSCLHPTIPVHAPLVVDLVDRRHGRAVGGCTYGVSHPGGRSHETFPVNALEAETRRAARFTSIGHTPGPIQLRRLPASEEMPVTLDLRRS